MAVFKCKMCGGALELRGNESVVTCEYCGTQQTLPKLNDERKTNLYDRANHFRRSNEFDKAMGIYEQILNEDNTDAESYWSLVLCRYGIEYVEDPQTHKRVPTVNRAQFTSVFDDDNYKAALQYADAVQRGIYEEEAKAINEIQKGILAISQKEEPFDVFICYKETDQNGRRTPDSVLANDLYHQLTQEGFKVFFSRITLEDKLGSAYEPYIFAALNSAKVMVVLGTKPEYFKAVWVRNEWSRYLGLIKQGQQKMLIPAYKDMDPYDLPEEFSHLQAQDMSKLGFMQDLIRGIKKITQMDEPQVTVVSEPVVTGGNANIETLLKRVFMFLEDEDWKSADEYCEKVLDIDPENADAYLGKLMASLHVDKQENLKHQKQPFGNNLYCKKIVRFGSAELQKMVKEYIDFIYERNENERLEDIYTRGKNLMDVACSEHSYQEAAKIFKTIPGYKNADSLVNECLEKAKECVYSQGKKMMEEAKTEREYQEAADVFNKITGYKDADWLVNECLEKAKECVYSQGKKMMEEAKTKNEYQEAADVFHKITGYKDADWLVNECLERAQECVYSQGKKMMEAAKTEKEYQEAADVFKTISDYKDAGTLVNKCSEARKDTILLQAKKRMEGNDIGSYRMAMSLLVLIKGWKDADEMYECAEHRIKVLEEKELERKRLEEEERLKQKRQFEKEHWKKHKFCQYCGGSFKGMVKKTCTSCGKPKDY